MPTISPHLCNKLYELQDGYIYIYALHININTALNRKIYPTAINKNICTSQVRYLYVLCCIRNIARQTRRGEILISALRKLKTLPQ